MIPLQIERKGAEVTLEYSNVALEKEGSPGFLYIFCYGTRGQQISLPPETQALTNALGWQDFPSQCTDDSHPYDSS